MTNILKRSAFWNDNMQYLS